MPRSIRHCLQALLLVPVLAMSPSAGEANRPEVDGWRVGPLTCRFKDRFDWEKGPGARSTFAVRGTPLHPQYLVTFDSYSGVACLERQGEFWPESFDLKIRGGRDTILSVLLAPDGYGEMSLLFFPNQKRVYYYDERGKCL